MDEHYKGVAFALILLTVAGLVALAGYNVYKQPQPIGPGPTANPGVLNASPSIEATPTPTPEPIDNASPSVNEEYPSYDDLLNYWKRNNNTTYNRTTNPTITPLLYGDPALENDVRIYDPNATPTPTPVLAPGPMSAYRISPLQTKDMGLIPDASMDTRVCGALAWDAEYSNFTKYAYPGDHPVFALRFVNNVNYDIVNPKVKLQVERQTLFGAYYSLQYVEWTETAVITKGKNLDAGTGPGAIVIYKDLNDVFEKGDIPEKYPFMGYELDTAGRYRIQVWIDDRNAQACYISQLVQIL